MTDISKWDFATTFTAHQAAALILGLEPNESSESQIQPVLESMNDCYSIAVSYRLTVSNPGMKQAIPPPSMLECSEMLLIDSYVTSGVIESSSFLKWLESDDSAFDQQTFTREQLTRWLKAISMPSKYIFISKKKDAADAQELERPLGTSERNTLLKLVIGMAIQGYRYNPDDSKSGVPKEIESDLDKLAISVSDDTVRKYLYEAEKKVLPKKRAS